MKHPNYVLLYVQNPSASAALYTDLLGKPPVEASPGFVLYALDSGLMLGLWATPNVLPAASGAAGGGEIAIQLDNDDAVGTLHAAWSAKGLRIAQPPTRLDFGYTFVALDLDGHRLRVFAPSAR